MSQLLRPTRLQAQFSPVVFPSSILPRHIYPVFLTTYLRASRNLRLCLSPQASSKGYKRKQPEPRSKNSPFSTFALFEAMTSAESRKSDESERWENKPTSSRRRMKGWGHNPPLALVYRAESPRLDVEEINDANSKLLIYSLHLISILFRD